MGLAQVVSFLRAAPPLPLEGGPGVRAVHSPYGEGIRVRVREV
jgi:hypothetical protein